MTDEVIARGEAMSVLGMEMRVMALEDVMTTKLMALDRARAALREPAPDRPRAARADRLGCACATAPPDSPFARAFFVLAEGLEILPGARRRRRMNRVFAWSQRAGSGPRRAG